MTSLIYILRKTALSFLAFGCAVLFLVGIVLIVAAETAEARVCGLTCVASAVVPLWIGFQRWLVKRKSTNRARSYLVLLALAMLLGSGLTYLCLATPTGESLPGSDVRSRFPGSVQYPRYSPWNLLPEIDQVKLGAIAAPVIDPLIDIPQTSKLYDAVIPLYRQMRGRPDYRSLGSVMHFGYAEMLGLPAQSGHYYECVPTAGDAGDLPVIIFLHGSVGNFKAYLFAWKIFADRYNCRVICPSFGSGEWEEGSVDVVKKIREEVLRNVDLCDTPVLLAGLSNGGKGVTRVAAVHGLRYDGLVYISAVLEPDILNVEQREVWNDLPVLILHAKGDRRVPYAQAVGFAGRLRRLGAAVEMHGQFHDDHFFMFTSLEATLAEIGRWVDLRRRSLRRR